MIGGRETLYMCQCVCVWVCVWGYGSCIPQLSLNKELSRGPVEACDWPNKGITGIAKEQDSVAIICKRKR